VRDITAEEFLTTKNAIAVDVRSPVEFKDGSIPEAVNIPLFSDSERSEIGTIYKQKGPDQAKWRAMELVSPKLPMILGQVKDLKENGRVPVLYCWRGGMRSKAVATFLEFSGIPAFRLTGGYRAYRKYILEQIPSLFPKKAVVLHGMTGVGKTEILTVLRTKGFPVLNLEELAAHRGSIFGSIGIGEGNNQKTFDALLFETLRELQGSDYVVIEAESKRIGKVVLPDELISRKMDGIHIHIEAPFEERVNRIYNEYVAPYQYEDWFFEKVAEGVSRIGKRINIDERNILLDAMQNGNYRKMIEILLHSYYDPRYEHKRAEYNGEFFTVYASDIQTAVEKIISLLTKVEKNEMSIF
jgi:tRNA 2-selenouridine synthase